MQSSYKDPFIALNEAHHEPAANTAATCTVAAVAGERHITALVLFGYDNTPTAGKLQWTIDGSTNTMPITTSDAKQLRIPIGMPSGINSAIVWTLTAGGAGVTGYMHVYYG
jgi:hypothetical protein